LSGARRVIETGVAYGWSSLAILSALEGRDGARLVSVDMPYPGRGNEAWVGVAVPEDLRQNWSLLRLPDRPGIPRAVAEQGGTIDLAHYDSDKSWYGRMYAFPHLWKALTPGGLLLMDDIQDNMAFAEIAEEHGLEVAVTTSGGKFVGLTRKPGAPTS
jgi:predicted O-methyltransferase YrrM